MMAKQMKTLELHYPVIQFLITVYVLHDIIPLPYWPIPAIVTLGGI